MKNIMIKVIPLLLALGCVLSLSACGMFGGGSSTHFSDVKPELDFDDAADNLEDNDYDVEVDDADKDDYGVKQYLYATDGDGNTLHMVEYEDSKLAKLAYEEKLAYYEAQAKATEAQIELLEYQLKEYEDDMKKSEVNELEDRIEYYEDELEELEDFTIGVSGKVVWSGTVEAAKASK